MSIDEMLRFLVSRHVNLKARINGFELVTDGVLFANDSCSFSVGKSWFSTAAVKSITLTNQDDDPTIYLKEVPLGG